MVWYVVQVLLRVFIMAVIMDYAAACHGNVNSAHVSFSGSCIRMRVLVAWI
jgi:hypothetical protein